ncbi:hypothetical protein [Haladaptatus sp. DFWS20]|uniref:hypothetical protein n=1 Tax=Haladaptatus sp. DFWS20 TaxID=3403467 RepID=UPI003EBABF57
MTFVGVIWIAVLTTICVVGIELSAWTQFLLLGMEIVTLAVFAAVALLEVYTGFSSTGSITPSLSWLNPFAIQD